MPRITGEKHHSARLTEEKVRWARELYFGPNGPTQAQLAARLGVTQQTMCKVLNRITWKHVDNGVDE